MPISAIDIKVFGVVRCNVHIVVKSRAIGHKWAQVLNRMFPGQQISINPYIDETKRGFLVSVAA